jgi:hypothetical protein
MISPSLEDPMQTETTRQQLTHAMRQVPFRPVTLELKDGRSVVIERPEQVAFDPTGKNDDLWPEFIVLGRHCRVLGSFDEIHSISINEKKSSINEETSVAS